MRLAGVEAGGATLHLSQLGAGYLALILAIQRRLSARAASWSIGLAGLLILAAVPSSLEFGIARLAPAGQFLANAVGFTAIASLATLSRPATLRRAVAAIAVGLAAMTVVAALVDPGYFSQTSSRVLGIQRPRAFFQEPTWLAIATAAVVALALQLDMRRTSRAGTIGGIALFTRTALVLIIAAWLSAAVQRGKAAKRLLSTGLICLWLVAGLQFASWYGTPVQRAQPGELSSLTTRGLDIAITRARNPDGFFPYGGRVIAISDPRRARRLPDTSNVWPFDMIWKLGIGGVFSVATVCVFLVLVLPRTLGRTTRWLSTQPVGVFLLLLPPAFVFNSAFGQPWLWLVAGLMYGVLARQTQDGRPSDGSARRVQHTRR